MTYRFLTEARAEFDAAVDWYEAQQAGLGDDFITEAYAAVHRVVAHPHAFGRAPGAPRGREVRQIKPHRFDYLVVYEVTANEVVILSVPHARSNRPAWRRRLPDPPTS